jgi:hypothetical protein
MADNDTPHPVRQLTLHHWRTDYGQAQLRPSSLHKGELQDQVLTLPLGILMPLIDASHLIGQALEVHLGCIPGLVHILKLSIKKGNPSSELTGNPTNKGQ